MHAGVPGIYVTIHDRITHAHCVCLSRVRKMAGKATPESGKFDSDSEEPSEASGSVWRVKREEIPLSRGDSRVILGERVRKRENPRRKIRRQTESQTLTGTLGKNEVRASQHGF